MNSKLNLMSQNKNDCLFTPSLAIEILIDYLPKDKVIWNATAIENDAITEVLRHNGYDVIETGLMLNDIDFFEHEPDNYDIQITNPPFSLKDKWIKRSYELGKPFCLLLPITALEGKRRHKCYRDGNLQMVIPDVRFHFGGPYGSDEKQTGGWFQTSWFTDGLNLPNDLNFVEIK